MYHIYKTEAIIVGGFEKNETSRVLYLFTRDLGLILAHVQGVRNLASKLRYSLQDLSLSSVDLVRGKGGWRIISAQSNIVFSHDGATPSRLEAVAVIARILLLLRRLVKGEEVNERLFDDIKGYYLFVGQSTMASEEVTAGEVVMVMRILNHLGYWGRHPQFQVFIDDTINRDGLFREMVPLKRSAVVEINKALKETQL